MRVLGLVPARGGSRGVPRKNIKLLCGKPLLAYTADAALSAGRLSRVVLSTEDPEIAEVGRRLGLDVPFLRPANLAQDETPMLPVVVHALEWLKERGEAYDAVCLLQPTNPLRRSEDIDACIELLEASGADSVIAVLPVPPEHNPHWVYLEDAQGRLHLSTGESTPIGRRQDLPAAFHREGSVYVTRCGVVLGGSLYGSAVVGYRVEAGRSVNIDTPEDWRRAEDALRVEVT
jgi:CMP-N,N'-diacetyllegionaminic acid synthase